MSVDTMRIVYTDDENIEFYVNNHYIGSANHDEDGSHTMNKIIDIFRSISKKLNITITEEYIEEI